jgi:hypothetical protein
MNRTTSLTLLCALSLAACEASRNAYYDVAEKLGYAKRERLVDSVKAARQEQVDAKQQFGSALEEYKRVVNVPSSDLEKAYDALSRVNDRSRSQADAVRSKITSVKNVAKALFSEWQREVEEIRDDPSLQQRSRSLFERTQKSTADLVARMDKAAASMDPVLTKLNNRVLFLKHNLNAQALGSLAGTERELGSDVERLKEEMEASIREAEAFIAELGQKAS